MVLIRVLVAVVVRVLILVVLVVVVLRIRIIYVRVDELACVVVHFIRFADGVRRVDGNGECAATLARLREAKRVHDMCTGSKRCLRGRRIRVRLARRELGGEVIHAT